MSYIGSSSTREESTHNPIWKQEEEERKGKGKEQDKKKRKRQKKTRCHLVFFLRRDGCWKKEAKIYLVGSGGGGLKNGRRRGAGNEVDKNRYHCYTSIPPTSIQRYTLSLSRLLSTTPLGWLGLSRLISPCTRCSLHSSHPPPYPPLEISISFSLPLPLLHSPGFPISKIGGKVEMMYVHHVFTCRTLV